MKHSIIFLVASALVGVGATFAAKADNDIKPNSNPHRQNQVPQAPVRNQGFATYLRIGTRSSGAAAQRFAVRVGTGWGRGTPPRYGRLRAETVRFMMVKPHGLGPQLTPCLHAPFRKRSKTDRTERAVLVWGLKSLP